MKASTNTWELSPSTREVTNARLSIDLPGLGRRLVRWGLAIAPGFAIVMASLWAATTPSVYDIYSAAVWASGFVFLALAVESIPRRAWPLAATGLSLTVLGFLGSRIAMEFSILASAVVAVWIAYGLLRRA